MKVLRYLLAIVAVIALGTLWGYMRFLDFDYPEEPSLPGIYSQGQLTHDGVARTFDFYVPQNRADNPAIVLAFHGSTSDGPQMRSGFAYQFDVLAEKHGFIAVYPNGFENHWNDCRKEGDYAANHQDIDDVGFSKAIIGFLKARFNADPGAVVATGLSNGGHMAYRLGLEAPEVVSAIVPFAAAFPARDNLDCTPLDKPVNILLVNGSGDPLVPSEGGVQEVFGQARGTVLSMSDSINIWARYAGYGMQPPVIGPVNNPNKEDESNIISETWDDPMRKLVRLYRVENGGHNIPNKLFKYPRILGNTNQDIDGAEAVWQFFEESRAR